MKSAILPGVLLLLWIVASAAWQPLFDTARITSIATDVSVAAELHSQATTDWSDCLACHNTPDAGLPPLSTFRPTGLGAGIASCEDCHTPLELADLPLDWTHPVRSIASHLECTDCHAVTSHNSGSPPPRPYGDYDAEGCFRCHREISAAMSSIWSHGPSPRVKCRDCHPAHQPLRIALPSALVPGPVQQTWAGNGDWWQSNSTCLDCHAATSLIFPLDRGFVTLNTVNYHELHLNRGQLLCVECHDPHGSARQGMIRGELLSGELLFFNEMLDGGSCTINCHGINHDGWRYINAVN